METDFVKAMEINTQATTVECELCNDTGWIQSKKMIREGKEVDMSDTEIDIVDECPCIEVKRCKKLLESSGIAEAFREKTLNCYVPKSDLQVIARSMAVDYIKSFKEIVKTSENSIAFLGQVGAGKTHLTIAIANSLLKLKVGVVYMQYREAITQLKQSITYEKEFQNILSRYKNAKVLIIDDLYKGMLKNGNVNESDINIMFDLINYRYLKKAPILVSSEYRLKDIIEFDEAVGTRIGEMAKGRIIEFEGKELNHRMC